MTTYVNTQRQSICVPAQTPKRTDYLDSVLRQAWLAFWLYRAGKTPPDLSIDANDGLRVFAEVMALWEDKLHNVETDLGHMYELIIRLGIERAYKDVFSENLYGLDVDPSRVPHKSMHHQISDKVNRQYVWSVMDRKLVDREAEKLCGKLAADWATGRGTFQIGSPSFDRAYKAALRRIAAGPRVAPWPLEVDVAADDPAVGLLEVKASGHIGGQKVKGVLKTHLIRGLAVCREDLPLRFGIFYRNKDDQTALRQHVRESSGHLLMPESLHALAFPAVSEERFNRRFETIGKQIGLKIAFSDAFSIPGGPDGIAEYNKKKRKGARTRLSPVA